MIIQQIGSKDGLLVKEFGNTGNFVFFIKELLKGIYKIVLRFL